MTILWFGILKAFLSVILLWLASYPVRAHAKRYEKARKSGDLRPASTLLPRRKRKYIPLVLALTVIIVTPFKIAPGEQAERTITSFDTPVRQAPLNEAKPRQEYGAPDNKEAINSITKEGSPE